MKKLFLTFLTSLATMAFCNSASAQAPAVTAPVVGIGDQLYDVEVHDVEGNYSYLSDYAGKDGKYLMVLFWTANCPRCHASFPEVAKYAKQYSDSLNIVGVMLSDNHQGWLEMYQYRKPFEWPNLSDGKILSEGAAVPYGISLYPTFVLVTPEGKIVKKWSGFKLEKFQAEMQPYFAPVQ